MIETCQYFVFLYIYQRTKMALMLFLFKVSNLNILKAKSNVNIRNDEDLGSEAAVPELAPEETVLLLHAKVIFRGIYLYTFRL